MSQDQANKMLPPVTGKDRVAVIFGALVYAGFSVWIVASFTLLANLLGLPVAIALVLAIPTYLWITLRLLRAHASEPSRIAIVSLGGLALALLPVVARDIALQSSSSPLSATFEGAVSALQWLGVALVAIGDLMLLVALGAFLLARLRTSA